MMNLRILTLTILMMTKTKTTTSSWNMSIMPPGLCLLTVHFPIFFLSSGDSSLPSTELEDLTSSNSLPPDLRKQGVTHINVTSEQVINSDGEERFKWMAAGRKELDNLNNYWNHSSS